MENNTKGAGDDYPIIPQPEKEEQPISDREPYFHLSKNEYGRMWLLYKPEGNGRYKCWEPITSEFWNEFEKLLRWEKELTSLKEENAKLKFRADLMSIYKQEKEDRDKILHQIKCTLYDRLLR